jgi:hypothetical protein
MITSRTALAVLTCILLAPSGANAELGRFIQVNKVGDTNTRFHLSELEVFANGVVPDDAGGASFGGLSTSSNDIGNGTLVTFGDGNNLPTVGTTSQLEHGGGNKNPNNALEIAGEVWSTSGDGPPPTGLLEQISPTVTSYTEVINTATDPAPPGMDFALFSPATIPSGDDVTAAIQIVPGNGDVVDFVDFVAGNIALIDRGVLRFDDKVRNAEAAGAVGVLIANTSPSEAGGLFQGGGEFAGLIPALMIRHGLGVDLKAQLATGPVEMHMAVIPPVDVPTQPQYTLDLGGTHDITTVRMWPRADSCCAERWRNLEVNIYADDGTGNPGKLVSSSNDARLLDPGGNVPLELTFGAGVEFAITEIIYDTITNRFTLEWASAPGQTFAVFFGTDLFTFASDIDDGIPAAEDGNTTTFGPFDNPEPGATKLFFRVEKQ